MKNRFDILLLLLLLAFGASAQEAVAVSDPAAAALTRTQEALLRFDAERLDSIDQERLPRKVTLGLLATSNVSNFIITKDGGQPMSSHMKVGWDLGGFIDFSVTKHFAIQGQVDFTAEQNRFRLGDERNLLWSFGANIPVYFLGRFGSQDEGYVSFGAGLFTHVTFASNVDGHYANNGASMLNNLQDVPSENQSVESDDYSELYKLHRFHSGVAATAIYEFSFGMQIFASYMVSLTDIFSFYAAYDGQEVANASIYPQRVSLGVGYRFRYKKEVKQRPREGRDHM